MRANDLTLGQRLAIALVPSSVPAVVLVVALGLSVAIGPLPEALSHAFEQIAGGALLITYMKELFPKVMEQGDAAVAALAGSRRGPALKGIKFGCTILMVGCIAVSAIAQAGAAGFPGMEHNETSSSGSDSFTPLSTIAYFVGFFVDGVVLAYDDDPVRCDATLVKKMIMSLVFAVDNLLDGFGLVPVLKEAFGDDYWVCMLLFSACVLLGAVCTALLRHFAPSPVFHLIWLSLATTSILVGSLQLCSHGLSIYVMAGIAIVWLVLFVGDIASETEEVEARIDEGAKTSLMRSQHLGKFLKATKAEQVRSKWHTSAAAAAFVGGGHSTSLLGAAVHAERDRERGRGVGHGLPAEVSTTAPLHAPQQPTTQQPV